MARDFSNNPEAEMEKLTARMVQLDRQFNDTFERCFERPDLAYDKWTKASMNDAHAYEILKRHLFALGDMPQGEARKERAIDASLRVADLFQEYRASCNRLEELRAVNPEHFDAMQRQIQADPDPWWVTKTPGGAPSDGAEPERAVDRDWWRER